MIAKIKAKIQNEIIVTVSLRINWMGLLRWLLSDCKVEYIILGQ